MSKPISTLKYLRDNLGMTGPEFMREWKALDKAEQEWYKQAARDEAAVLGVPLSN